MSQIDYGKIKCLAYDFDGVMTDNRVFVTEDGGEGVFCNRSDGLAVSEFRKKGFYQVIVSTETNTVVEARARKMSIDIVHSVEDKGDALRSICYEKGFDFDEVLYIGNDVNDIPAFSVAGATGCPGDAEKIIKDQADWVSDRNGGYGVIRSLYDDYLSYENNKRGENN